MNVRLVSNMNSSDGNSSASDIHDTIINSIGNFSCLLMVGSVQKMNFTAHNSGSFWLSPFQKTETKYDRILTGSSTKQKTKAELLI